MKVICRGHETCGNSIACLHSKPHDIIINQIGSMNCFINDQDEDDCICIMTISEIRKQKLKKLNEKIL